MVAVALVVARFYGGLAEEMEREAKARLADRGAEHAKTVSVPGVYDAPLAADRLARREAVDAVAVLGTVVAGDTDHDQVVTHAAARELAAVSRERDTPVTFGVSGPDASDAEARYRVEYCADAAAAAVDMVEGLPEAGG